MGVPVECRVVESGEIVRGICGGGGVSECVVIGGGDDMNVPGGSVGDVGKLVLWDVAADEPAGVGEVIGDG